MVEEQSQGQDGLPWLLCGRQPRKRRNQYLLRFALHLRELRYGELDSILDMLGLEPTECYDRREWETGSHFLVVKLPSDAVAAELARRGILILGVYELWGAATNMEDLMVDVAAHLDEEVKSRYLGPSTSWSIVVEGVGYSYPVKDQNAKRAQVCSVVPLQGPVVIKRPDVQFHLIDNFIAPGDDCGVPSSISYQSFFGREMGSGITGRAFVGQDDLKRRIFLGPTSLPSEIALIMANMAQAKRRSYVIDPFVGTGSILIACARFGAFCVGTDIDIRILRGKGGGNVFSNFKQYGLPMPELLRSDNSLYEGHFRVLPMYDAIVCDPPYGIRAGARRTGSRREEVAPVSPNRRDTHIPMTRPYAVNDVMTDLLSMAAKSLMLGGRLVYLLPWCPLPELEPDQFIPTHPCLEFVRVCDQPFSTKLWRKVIIMKKVKEPSPEDPLPGRLEGAGEEYMDHVVRRAVTTVLEEPEVTGMNGGGCLCENHAELTTENA